MHSPCYLLPQVSWAQIRMHSNKILHANKWADFMPARLRSCWRLVEKNLWCVQPHISCAQARSSRDFGWVHFPYILFVFTLRRLSPTLIKYLISTEVSKWICTSYKAWRYKFSYYDDNFDKMDTLDNLVFSCASSSMEKFKEGAFFCRNFN